MIPRSARQRIGTTSANSAAATPELLQSIRSGRCISRYSMSWTDAVAGIWRTEARGIVVDRSVVGPLHRIGLHLRAAATAGRPFCGPSSCAIRVSPIRKRSCY